MAAFRKCFITYAFNSIKTLSSTYTEETTRRERNYPAKDDDHQFFKI